MSRKALCLLAAALLLPLAGCAATQTAADNCYVYSVAIDTGEVKKYNYTLQMPDISKLVEGGGATSGVMTVSAQADNFYEAVEQIELSLAWKPNFAHTNFICVSEELARSGEVSALLYPVMRYFDLRQAAGLIVCRGSAADFVSGLNNVRDPSYAKVQSNLLREPELLGVYPRCITLLFFENLLTDYQDTAVPLGAANPAVKGEEEEEDGKGRGQDGASFSSAASPAAGALFAGAMDDTAGNLLRKGGLASEMLGTAVFDEGIMVGELTGEESKYMLIGRGDFGSGTLAIERDGFSGSISARQLKRPKVTITSLDPLTADIHVYLSGKILQDARADPLGEATDKGFIEEATRAFTEARLSELAGKATEWNSDLFGMGRHAVKYFADLYEWEAYGMNGRIAAMKLNWQVDINLVRTEYNARREGELWPRTSSR